MASFVRVVSGILTTKAMRLFDPDFEPTDEELMELSRAAFADCEERHRVALAKLHAHIAEMRRMHREAARGSDPLEKP